MSKFGNHGEHYGEFKNPRGITVNAVAPGFIGTEILESIDPKKLEDMAKNIPVGRIGDVTDISNIVSFLASDESSYITGQVLHVNGGLTLWAI